MLLLPAAGPPPRRDVLADLLPPDVVVPQRPRSKTNQRGDTHELVVLPYATNPQRCPVTALQTWLCLAGITDGAVFRAVSRGNRALDRRLTAGAVNDILQTAVTAAGLDNPPECSAHSLPAGFVTYAHTRGATDHAIAHRTRHRSLTSVGTYIRTDTAWDDNAATRPGFRAKSTRPQDDATLNVHPERLKPRSLTRLHVWARLATRHRCRSLLDPSRSDRRRQVTCEQPEPAS